MGWGGGGEHGLNFLAGLAARHLSLLQRALRSKGGDGGERIIIYRAESKIVKKLKNNNLWRNSKTTYVS